MNHSKLDFLIFRWDPLSSCITNQPNPQPHEMQNNSHTSHYLVCITTQHYCNAKMNQLKKIQENFVDYRKNKSFRFILKLQLKLMYYQHVRLPMDNQAGEQCVHSIQLLHEGYDKKITYLLGL